MKIEVPGSRNYKNMTFLNAVIIPAIIDALGIIKKNTNNSIFLKSHETTYIGNDSAHDH